MVQWQHIHDDGGERWYTLDNETLGSPSIFRQGDDYDIRPDNGERHSGPVIAGPFPDLDSAKAAYLLVTAAMGAA